uniref:Uncharacterized protein n=1 Tax=Ciona intestinalis TaxID=7719 RepID=H2XLQ8_CIOIN
MILAWGKSRYSYRTVKICIKVNRIETTFAPPSSFYSNGTS